MCRRAAPTSKTVNHEGAFKVLRRITHRATPPPLCQPAPIPPPPLYQSPPNPPPPRCPCSITANFYIPLSSIGGPSSASEEKCLSFIKECLASTVERLMKLRRRLRRYKVHNAIMAATMPVRALFRCVLIFAGQNMSALLHAVTPMYRNGPAMIAMKPSSQISLTWIYFRVQRQLADREALVPFQHTSILISVPERRHFSLTTNCLCIRGS